MVQSRETAIWEIFTLNQSRGEAENRGVMAEGVNNVCGSFGGALIGVGILNKSARWDILRCCW
jgi:hypothetical protein